jgi:4-amino-4-deoxy-L-arabinose transferase-like glycosyltransferase
MQRIHSHSKSSIYILLSILVVASVLRLYAIDQPFIDAFSWRQSSTAMMSENFYRKNWNIFYPEVNWNGAGPSYQGREFQTVTYIAALFYVVLGQQDWIGRSVSIAFGLWGIFALYQLVHCVWDEPRALASAAVMALLPGNIFIDRSFLPDPAMVALVTTSTWLLVRHFQCDRFFDLVLATLVGAWGFLTKLPGLVIGLPMLYVILSALHHQKWYPKKLKSVLIASFLVMAPVIAYYLWALHLSLSYPPYHFAGGGNWVWDHGLMTWLQEDYYLPKLIKHIQGWLWTPPATVLIILGLLIPIPCRSMFGAIEKPILLFHGWMAAAILFYLVGAREIVDNPWNLHLVNPAAAALAGHALVSLSTFLGQVLSRLMKFSGVARTLTSRVLALLLPITFLLCIGFSGRTRLAYMYYPYAEQGYQLGKEMQRFSQADELVMTIANDLGDPVAIYYSQRRGWVFPPPWEGISWGNQEISDDDAAIQLFDELRHQKVSLLGIVGDRKVELRQNNTKFMTHVEQHSDLVEETEAVLIYRVYPPNSQ